MKCWTVYCHTHIESGRRYIGLTSKTMMARWNGHLDLAKRSNGKRSHFAAAIKKYGKDAFSHESLAQCRSLEDANATEIAIIDQYDTRNPEKGFNLMRGGSHIPHPVKNPWDRPGFRENQIIKQKEVWANPEVYAKRCQIMAQANNSPKYRAKRSIVSKELWRNSNFRHHVSESTRIAYSDPNVRAKLSTALKGRKLSNETRINISMARKKMTISADTRTKIRESMNKFFSQKKLRCDYNIDKLDCGRTHLHLVQVDANSEKCILRLCSRCLAEKRGLGWTITRITKRESLALM